MTPTTTPLGPDFVKELIPQILESIGEGTKIAYRMLWDILINFLIEKWALVLGALAFFLVVAIIRYFMTGRWAMLGGILYSYIYYGILFLIGLIFGPEVFANDWFALVLLIIYIVSLVWVGMILRKVGSHRF